ncbi:MAG TPA: DNA-processing protein DprA [Methylomirabilota bacterium]|nr:DNA-processing protein DprA [Methylomirabilota bacterium]
MHLLEEKIFANALNQLPGLGPVRLTQLYSSFGSWAKAWANSPQTYAQAGIPLKTINEIITKKSKINPEQSFAEMTRRGIEVVLNTEKNYPELLKEISSAPPLLYVRGNKAVLNSLGMAVVGTRKISLYGKQICEELVNGLVQNNISIVSGLAYGVDAAALTACVENDGKAIAVLASDLDNTSISPRVNFNLAQKIMKNGCLVSEYPLGAETHKQNFPVRNRLISGLAVGTVVVEADLESGSLITADFALEQNREVFAVPGSIFSQTSRGTNELIRKGAHIVTGIGSILDELNLTNSELLEDVPMDTTEEEQSILSHLSKEPIQIEELIRTLKLPARKISASLTMLEMKGRVKNLGGTKYIKIR